MPLSDKELEKRFAAHAVSALQISDLNRQKDAVQFAAVLIDTLSPDSREKSLALTHLETALFWADAAVARRTL